MLAVYCQHDDQDPCPVCVGKGRVRLRVVTPEGVCPPRVIPCPHCTDATAVVAAAIRNERSPQ